MNRLYEMQNCFNYYITQVFLHKPNEFLILALYSHTRVTFPFASAVQLELMGSISEANNFTFVRLNFLKPKFQWKQRLVRQRKSSGKWNFLNSAGKWTPITDRHCLIACNLPIQPWNDRNSLNHQTMDKTCIKVLMKSFFIRLLRVCRANWNAISLSRSLHRSPTMCKYWISPLPSSKHNCAV